MSKNRSPRRSGCLLLFLVLFLLLFIAFSENLRTVRYTVTSPEITSPVRLVLLSDLHSSSYGKGQKQLLTAIRKAAPDVICLTGDIFDDKASRQGALDLVNGLADSWPCFYVSGNHEHWSREDTAIKALLTAHDITVLAGDAVPFTVGEQTILFGGIDDPTGFVDMGEIGMPDKETWYGQLTLVEREAVVSPYYTILLSHRPELVELYRKSPFDLVLAGHAHGGQIRLPFLSDGLFSPGEGYFPSYTGGVHDLGGTTLLISRGLCKNELPRVFNPPELVVIDLAPAP